MQDCAWTSLAPTKIFTPSERKQHGERPGAARGRLHPARRARSDRVGDQHRSDAPERPVTLGLDWSRRRGRGVGGECGDLDRGPSIRHRSPSAPWARSGTREQPRWAGSSRSPIADARATSLLRRFRCPLPFFRPERAAFPVRPFRLSDSAGQVVVINYWASWCPPCRADLTVLSRLVAGTRHQGVAVVGIATLDTSAAATSSFSFEIHRGFPSYFDRSGRTAEQLGGIPARDASSHRYRRPTRTDRRGLPRSSHTSRTAQRRGPPSPPNADNDHQHPNTSLGLADDSAVS